MSKATRGSVSGRSVRLLILALALSSLGPVLAACGGSKDDASTSAPTIDHTLGQVGTHDVALKKVMLLPDETEIAANGVQEIVAGESLLILVTFENRGDVDEMKVPVTVTLVSPSTPRQSLTRAVLGLLAGDATDIVVKGLNPTAYGEQATLTVMVGPAEGETALEDNQLTATVLFKE